MAYNGMNRSSRARRDACLGNSTDAGTSRRFEFKDAVRSRDISRYFAFCKATVKLLKEATDFMELMGLNGLKYSTTSRFCYICGFLS